MEDSWYVMAVLVWMETKTKVYDLVPQDTVSKIAHDETGGSDRLV